MAVFVDTSALYALLDEGQQRHQEVVGVWNDLRSRQEQLITTNYVVLELCALSARRLGLPAAREFQVDFAPVLDVCWVDEVIHGAGVSAWIAAARRQLSLVDCVSFEAMRRLGLVSAFTLDADFARQGFQCIP